MSLSEFYMTLPFDLSGSRSKNRFRNEVLWGLEKTFEVYRSGEDFTIVFDYVSDVEVHLSKSGVIEFYQVKTRNTGESYTLNEILKRKKNKSGEYESSVLGKLYILKHFPQNDDNEPISKPNVKIAIVSNKPLRCADNTLHSSCPEIEFSQLDDKSRNFITSELNKEFGSLDYIDLEKIFFIYTSMNLFDPQATLLGKLVLFFNEAKGEDPVRPIVLYKALENTATQKACYELKSNDYVSLTKHKGLTRSELDSILNAHTKNADISVEKAREFIDHEFVNDFDELTQWRKAITEVVCGLSKSQELRRIEMKMIGHLQGAGSQGLSRIGIIDSLASHFSHLFPLEFNAKATIRALALLAQCKYLEEL